MASARDGGTGQLLGAAITAGLILRLMHYVGQASLSMDESRLANNIAARTLGQLSTPLDYDQSAPLLFLWVERLMTRVFGVNELALRAVPMVAGALLLVVAYPFLRRLVGSRAAVLGVAVLAASPAMVTYSNEIKQYMLEVLVAVVLVRLALDTVVAPREPVGFKLAAAGAFAVW
ncbi:MAG: glycosyltransferase family 39 protein, partial [Gemmatimonadales bacterium]